MSNKTYDTLKFLALIVTPIITFAASIINTWGIPHGTEIVASLAALDALIGAIVAVAKAVYDKKGTKDGKDSTGVEQ